MDLKPVPVTLHRYGTHSAGIIVPRQLARAIGLEPGTSWRVRLAPGQPSFMVTVRALGGTKESVGFIIPAKERKRLGIDVGSQIEVPVATWKPAAGATPEKKGKKEKGNARRDL